MTRNATPRSGLRRARAVLLGAALMLGAPTAAHAQSRTVTLLVLPATGAGVSAKMIQTARSLFVERLGERDRDFLILDMDRPPVTTPLPPSHAVRMGYDREARAVFLFDVRRAEATTVVTVSGFAVPGGEKLFAFEESTTRGPEVLPAIVERAVDNAIIYRVKPPAPEPRTVFIGARANGVFPFNTAGRTDALLLGAGAYLLKDGPHSFYTLGFDFVSQNDNVWAVKFGIGGYATFWPEDDTPYFGLSLCWKGAKLGGQGDSGVELAPAVGVTWRHRSLLSVRIEAGLFVDLFTESGIDRLRPGSSDPHRSYGPQLSVGGWL